MTTFLKVKNRAVSTLASGISDSDLSLDVAAGEGARFPSTYPFHITIDDEILSCTNRSSDTLTVTRAQEGTNAASHSEGAVVSLNVTAGVIEALQDNIRDADEDTAFEVEQAADEDKIHGKVAGVEAFLLHNNGILDLVKQSACWAYLLAEQADVVPSTYTKVELDAEEYDVQNEFDTANHKFTATKAGRYLIVARVTVKTMSDGERITTAVYKNGAKVIDNTYNLGADAYGSAIALAILSLAANDYLELYVYHNHGTNRDVDEPKTSTFLQVAKVM